MPPQDESTEVIDVIKQPLMGDISIDKKLSLDRILNLNEKIGAIVRINFKSSAHQPELESPGVESEMDEVDNISRDKSPNSLRSSVSKTFSIISISSAYDVVDEDHISNIVDNYYENNTDSTAPLLLNESINIKVDLELETNNDVEDSGITYNKNNINEHYVTYKNKSSSVISISSESDVEDNDPTSDIEDKCDNYNTDSTAPLLLNELTNMEVELEPETNYDVEGGGLISNKNNIAEHKNTNLYSTSRLKKEENSQYSRGQNTNSSRDINLSNEETNARLIEGEPYAIERKQSLKRARRHSSSDSVSSSEEWLKNLKESRNRSVEQRNSLKEAQETISQNTEASDSEDNEIDSQEIVKVRHRKVGLNNMPVNDKKLKYEKNGLKDDYDGLDHSKRSFFSQSSINSLVSSTGKKSKQVDQLPPNVSHNNQSSRIIGVSTKYPTPKSNQVQSRSRSPENLLSYSKVRNVNSKISDDNAHVSSMKPQMINKNYITKSLVKNNSDIVDNISKRLSTSQSSKNSLVSSPGKMSRQVDQLPPNVSNENQSSENNSTLTNFPTSNSNQPRSRSMSPEIRITDGRVRNANSKMSDAITHISSMKPQIMNKNSKNKSHVENVSDMVDSYSKRPSISQSSTNLLISSPERKSKLVDQLPPNVANKNQPSRDNSSLTKYPPLKSNQSRSRSRSPEFRLADGRVRNANLKILDANAHDSCKKPKNINKNIRTESVVEDFKDMEDNRSEENERLSLVARLLDILFPTEPGHSPVKKSK